MSAATWSAPGRVNLIGEHTDYNDGLVLPVALDRRTRVRAARRDDDLVEVTSAQTGETVRVPLGTVGPGSPAGWSAYAVGVVWALARTGPGPAAGERGLTLHVDSDVPLGAGLSSSAALECAVALAVDDLWGLGLGADDAGRARLAEACVEAENVVAGAPTGGMDQAASLRCRPGHALLLDCRSGAVEHVPCDPAADGLALLVIDTRVQHALADGQYGARRAGCEAAAAALGVAALRDVHPEVLDAALARVDPDLRPLVRHVVTETERVRRAAAALRGRDWAALGELFVASHASLRDDYAVSCAELDLVVGTALEHGAAGARMTGGGFGGSAVVLVDRERVEPVTSAVEAAFASRGLRSPSVREVVPGGPAAREPT